MRPIRSYKYLPEINAYVIQRKDDQIIGWIQTLFHNWFYLDYYDIDGHIIYQGRVRSKNITIAVGSNGIDAKGCIIDGIKLYRENIDVNLQDPSLIFPHEKKHYLPGLARLKALGYKVTKIL